MRYINLLFCLVCNIFLFQSADAQTTTSARYQQAFESILKQHQLAGSISILDVQKDSLYTNNVKALDQGHLPASTFKIPNSIIALETGVMKDENTILLWDGEPRSNINWEKDLTLQQAFRLSCVPCYQQIAKSVGVARMQENLTKIGYPKININDENLTKFWLVGEAKITPRQQIKFLREFFERKISISDNTYQTMLRIMEIENTSTHTFSGKTGWSTDHGDNGWFVGYLMRGKDMYYFAINVEPKDPDALEQFLTDRERVARQALATMQLL